MHIGVFLTCHGIVVPVILMQLMQLIASTTYKLWPQIKHLDLLADYTKDVTQLYKPLKVHGVLECSYNIMYMS